MMKDGAYRRNERLQDIARFIVRVASQYKGEITFEAAMNYAMFNPRYSLKESTAREYVNTIIRVKEWKCKDGIISIKNDVPITEMLTEKEKKILETAE